MEIRNTYGETIAHYRLKLFHVQEELDAAAGYLRGAQALDREGWQSRAGEALLTRYEDLERQIKTVRDEAEQACDALMRLNGEIEEELRRLAQEQTAP